MAVIDSGIGSCAPAHTTCSNRCSAITCYVTPANGRGVGDATSCVRSYNGHSPSHNCILIAVCYANRVDCVSTYIIGSARCKACNITCENTSARAIMSVTAINSWVRYCTPANAPSGNWCSAITCYVTTANSRGVGDIANCVGDYCRCCIYKIKKQCKVFTCSLGLQNFTACNCFAGVGGVANNFKYITALERICRQAFFNNIVVAAE